VSIEKLQAHHGFTRMPFRRDLAPGMLHRHAAHAEAAARISWCISEHALGVITGEVGAGKTVALRAALASLDPSRHTLIYLGNPSVGVRGINHAIVAALGGVPRTHHATLTPQAMDLLAREHAERGRIPVLAIDEAHMPGPAQLEAIRMLTNHDLDATCPLACLLIGQPTLRRRIKLGILAALDHRIAVRYTMPGMTPDETSSYIRHHLKIAGRSDPLFSDDAIALIHATSRGLPRRQQPRDPGAHRRLRRPQGHGRRIQRPRRSRRSHGRLTTKPPARTPRPRRNTTSGAFPCPHILTASDAAIIKLNVRAQRVRRRLGDGNPRALRSACDRPRQAPHLRL
jgi:type II secretory pathway predicted ATPase ExeA